MPAQTKYPVSFSSSKLIEVESGKRLNNPDQMGEYIRGIPLERLEQAKLVARSYRFRAPEFYVKRVLQGNADDPLLDIVLPSLDEVEDGDELWDATPSSYAASDSPFWIQKYEYQGLLRLTTVCSGLCRFCYLKKKNVATLVMRVQDVDKVFDDLEVRGQKLREIILSGGDPLCAPADTLGEIGVRVRRLRAMYGGGFPYIAIHTREPVWDPVRLLKKRGLWEALNLIQPKVVMLNVLHPREVTPEFLDACAKLADAGGTKSRAALLCQHPIFRGVNDSAEILEELYGRLLRCSPPILPYYMVHPFYNGTLKRHRLTLEESQEVYRQLIRRPGCLAPKLVVPTPWGKCVIGPNEQLKRVNGMYQLITKDGKEVQMP